MNADSSKPTPNRPEGRDFDPEVARRLRPLAQTPAPDTWSQVAAESPTEVALAATDGPTTTINPSNPSADRSKWRRPLLATAAIIALVAAGVAIIPRDGQRVETPATADNPAADGEDTSVTDDDEGTDQTTTSLTPSPNPTFPDDVEIGPDRTAMSSIPFGSFALIYDAGAVIMDPDAEVLGHYPTPAPAFLVPDSDPPASTNQLERPDCVPDPSLPNVVLCRRELGPTVELVDGSTDTVVLAAFPPPPEGLPAEAHVVGHFTKVVPSLATFRPAPALLQMSAECESRIAMMADALFGTDTGGSEHGIVRHLDGTSYWDESWPAGESVALGWSDDGGEAYIWRFNGLCSDPLDEPGVYAYQLDGSSRLLLPTNNQVHQVILITEDLFEPTSTNGLADMERSEDWKKWAGPLTYESVRSEDLNSDPAYWTDLELIGRFAAEELDITGGDYALSAADNGAWIVSDRDISIRLGPNTWFGTDDPTTEDLEQWHVERADTFWPNGNHFLTAKVSEQAGDWTAVFQVPTHRADVSASYELSGRQVEATFTDDEEGTVEIKVALDGEPTEPAILTLRWHDGDRLIGFQREIIPPGEFATG